MAETHVVTAFLRHGPDVLLARRSEHVGTYEGRWAGISGYAEGDPDSQVWVEIREETGLNANPDEPRTSDVSLVRAGDPIDVVDDSGTSTRHWVVHPYLFDVDTRDITSNEELAATDWVPPTANLEPDRETVPGLWDAYNRVRPTKDTIAADTEHGSAYISLRALDVLRDEAALASDWNEIADVARVLLDARPDMTAVQNRVNRVMHDASTDTRRPSVVHDAAIDVANDAVNADSDAAARAAELLKGSVVATNSRSGTFLDAVRRGGPDGVLVSESRPGGEGVAVAETLADSDAGPGLDVTLTSDANLPNTVADCDLALVGADSVHPDGSVVNKVGTYALALGADAADIPLYAVCAADKIAPDADEPTEQAPAGTLYEGDAHLDCQNPLFDVTPAGLVTGLVTEAGVLDPEAVRERAADHRRLADWA